MDSIKKLISVIAVGCAELGKAPAQRNITELEPEPGHDSSNNSLIRRHFVQGF